MAISAAGIWGVGDVVGKHLVGATAPMIVVLVQLGCSTLISWIIVTIKFQYVEFGRSTFVGCLLGFLHPGLSSSLGIIGLSHIDASISSTIWALEAVMTMMLAWALLAERISVVQAALSVVSLVGVLLAATSIDQMTISHGHLYGISALLVAVLSCGLYSVMARQVATESNGNAFVIVAGQQMTGLLWIGLMLPLALEGEETQMVASLSSTAWLLCAATGVLKYLLATALFVVSLRYLSASVASSFLVLTPVFGISAAFAFLGEQLSGLQWLGVAIVLLSVLAVQFADRRSEK
jgi:drug/metabolite transporter (DMT)-like permease